MTVLVADEGLLGLAELVPSHCEIRWYSGRDISPILLEGYVSKKCAVKRS